MLRPLLGDLLEDRRRVPERSEGFVGSRGSVSYTIEPYDRKLLTRRRRVDCDDADDVPSLRARHSPPPVLFYVSRRYGTSILHVSADCWGNTTELYEWPRGANYKLCVQCCYAYVERVKQQKNSSPPLASNSRSNMS